MANQVLSRPMFKQSPTASAVAPTVSGLGSMTTPDQNAAALKNMFSPQVPLARPAQSFPTPESGYKRGGEVIDGVAHFADGAEVVAPAREIPAYAREGYDPTTPEAAQRYLEPSTSQFRRDASQPMPSLDPNATDPETLRVLRDREEILRRRKGIDEAGHKFEELRKTPAPPGYLEAMPESVYRQRTEQSLAPLREAQQQAEARVAAEPQTPQQTAAERLRAAGIASLTPEARMAMEDQDRRDQTVPGGMFSRAVGPAAAASAPAAPPAKPPTDLELQLQSIKARREQSDQDKEQNKYLALLSAGLGMMAGTNRNAFANIGAGGQQGVQTYAGLEKARREDEATRRHEDIQMAQLAQQKQIAMAQLAQDPETIRTYAVLGGATANSTPEQRQAAVKKGFEFMQSKDAIKHASDLLKLSATDPLLLTPEQKTELGKIVYGSVSSGVGTQGGRPAGWGGQLVSPAPTR